MRSKFSLRTYPNYLVTNELGSEPIMVSPSSNSDWRLYRFEAKFDSEMRGLRGS
jgi:hypothetical protein